MIFFYVQTKLIGMDTSSNYPEHHFVNNWTQVMNHSLKILYSYRYIQGVPEKKPFKDI